MQPINPTVHALCQRLLASETRDESSASDAIHPLLTVLEKLRAHLSIWVGIVGFQALLARALALSRREIYWLDDVEILPDGAIEGFATAAQQQSPDQVTAGSVSLLGQLLGLLVTFIGEDLTLRLVADVWPEARRGETDTRAEEASR
jgi:hypothetical protein